MSARWISRSERFGNESDPPAGCNQAFIPMNSFTDDEDTMQTWSAEIRFNFWRRFWESHAAEFAAKHKRKPTEEEIHQLDCLADAEYRKAFCL